MPLSELGLARPSHKLKATAGVLTVKTNVAAWICLICAPVTICTVSGGEVPSREMAVESVLLAAAEVQVPAAEDGAIVELAVTEGALVNPGDLLARIDDADARLDLSRAQIELANARRNADNDIKIRVASAAADVAAAELRRAGESQKRYPGSVSQAELDHLRLAAEHASLQVEQARYDTQTAQLALRVHENAVERAERQLERRRITAPSAGRVVQVFRQPGEWVEAGQPVLRLLRLDRLKAVGYLNSRAVVRDLTGLPVRLEVQLPGEQSATQFSGRIAFVHSEVNPVTGQLDFWAEIENPELRLWPGQKASLTILPGPTP